MLFVKGKPAVQLELCTKAGNSPYNKGGALTLVEKDRVISQHSYKGGGLAVLRPVIDKLILGYDLKDVKNHSHQIKNAFVTNAEAMAEELAFFCKATPRNVGATRFYELQKYYHHNFLMTYKPAKTKIILQFEQKYSGHFMKLECNPARLGSGGMTFLRDMLKAVTFNDYEEFSLERIGLEPNGVKRLDIAVDLLGVDASDIYGAYVDKAKTPKKEVYQSPVGRAESVYFKLPNHDKNEAYWYNKRQQIKDDQSDPIDGGELNEFPNALRTRFEYRVNDTTKPLMKMKSLMNHLAKVSLETYDFERLERKNFTNVLFLKYAMLRTPEKAMEIVPDEEKTGFKKVLRKTRLKFWDADKIWTEGWIKELEFHGFLLPKKKKKKK